MYKNLLLKLIVFTALIGITSCKEEHTQPIPNKINWDIAHQYYLTNIKQALSYLDSLKMEGFNGKNAKFYFKQARIAFKKAEPFASHLNPEVGHRANGPALPIYKEDNGKILKPVGFQKIEESIYTQETTKADFENEVFITHGLLNVLKKDIEKRPLNPKRFFVSTHQQLMRLVSLAMAGFDTPVSQLSIKETATSLESLLFVYKNTLQSVIISNNKDLDSAFKSNIENAVKYINNNTDFITFDRFTFTRDYLNEITRNWVEIRKVSDLWEPTDWYPFNFNAPTFFENNAFNTNYFVDVNDKNPTKKQVELGKKLFFDKKISKTQTLACASCHLPEKGYADGLALGKDNTGNNLERNTPTLINSVYQKNFFWDGRASTITGQIGMVFTNKKEFNTEVHQFSDEILTDSTYINLFKEAYGSVPKNNRVVIRALSSFVATLNGFNSKFDKNIRGEENTFTPQEKLGYNLFMGKALCATCHFMPLTNGTVPPFYSETEKEVIGVPETKANKALDDDYGYYWKFKEDLHKGMFKTPTVRNITLTAPYMHNGVYNTLEEVLDFYNQGGGGGLGFNLPHQTLPFDNLDLTIEEQQAIIAFMNTLTDKDYENY
ncbi:cytochrome-c peroxidase [Tamlana sp. 62-3]|uniref:Cytochrome-c peroxidase n=1 Tax=Neotamlana sargassicola TaxID=2883125 RepID=A0A9X1I6C8_9FLAO|nr:cytochrome c peroxidase [Tamlana sargassicola]MCB4808138.1 cytochrome-c peroxidase [Tamlana sargassicola]